MFLLHDFRNFVKLKLVPFLLTLISGTDFQVGFRRVRKSAKSDYQLRHVSVCVSVVRPSAWINSAPLNGFS